MSADPPELDIRILAVDPRWQKQQTLYEEFRLVTKELDRLVLRNGQIARSMVNGIALKDTYHAMFSKKNDQILKAAQALLYSFKHLMFCSPENMVTPCLDALTCFRTCSSKCAGYCVRSSRRCSKTNRRLANPTRDLRLAINPKPLQILPVRPHEIVFF